MIVVSFMPTFARTITLTTITAGTDNDLGMTTTTRIKAAGDWHRQKMSMRAGFITLM
jgi:hypothetical protein